ncbi:hypothetical protein [Cereibacter azotoformans]|uniref:hypothetical protein n=1 Tax=Cereibacter azotoformans TaxID=43057 RepID=UPI000C6D45A8|nr:hypothetical protein [Cereibacter azotoformans]
MDLPTIIPTQNNHRVVHFSGDSQPRDFERLEELGADAVAAAREAISLMPLLPTHLFNGLHSGLEALVPHIQSRRLLNDRARLALEICLQDMNDLRSEVAEEDEESFEEIGRLLLAALQLSNRVSDLLAVEKEIGWWRGIRVPE